MFEIIQFFWKFVAVVNGLHFLISYLILICKLNRSFTYRAKARPTSFASTAHPQSRHFWHLYKFYQTIAFYNQLRNRITFFGLVINIAKIEKGHTDHTTLIRINCTIVNSQNIFSTKPECRTILPKYPYRIAIYKLSLISSLPKN